MLSQETQVAGAYELYLQGRGYLLSYREPGVVDLALERFSGALAKDPRYAPAHAGLGEAYWRKYETSTETAWIERARQACQRALALDGRLADAHVCLGTLDNGTGQYERAAAEFQRALELEQTRDDAYLGLALAYENLENAEAAEATFRRALDARAHYWFPHVWLGRFYRRQARFAESVAEYERAVALAPDSAWARAMLGGAFAFLGRYDDAIDALRRSLEIGPTYAAYANWGVTYFKLRRFQDSISMLEQARALRLDYLTLSNLARAYYWAGDRARARELYERAIELGQQQLRINPRSAEVALSLAECHARLGRKAEARALLESLSLGRDPHLHFFAAIVRNQLGDRPGALELLEQAVARRLPRQELADWVEFDNLRSEPRFRALLKSS